MIDFSYNLSTELRESLEKIEDCRRQVILTMLSPKSELTLKWEKLAEKIYGISVLGKDGWEKGQIIKILASGGKKRRSREKRVISIRRAFDYIHFNWFISSEEITEKTVGTIYEKLCIGKYKTGNEQIISLLRFVEKANEHPIVKAGIIYNQIINLSPFDQENLVMASLLSYLFLNKYGYNFRGFMVLEECFLKSKGEYQEILVKTKESGNITLWLEYFARGLTEQLEKVVREISKENFQNGKSPSFWDLSERQKEILSILENPDVKMTNRKAQKLFGVSQITASRDLTKLATLGLVLQHGKGRSVFYTKI